MKNIAKIEQLKYTYSRITTKQTRRQDELRKCSVNDKPGDFEIKQGGQRYGRITFL